MSRLTMPSRPRRAGFPRVSGDEPPSDLQWLDSQKFSPRERG